MTKKTWKIIGILLLLGGVAYAIYYFMKMKDATTKQEALINGTPEYAAQIAERATRNGTSYSYELAKEARKNAGRSL